MGKNKKGITLIALVVTIIVLLILAGVSILMLTGENSGLSKARWAEFVNEYGNLDEVKNVFALEQQAIENYDIKINKKFKLKDIFINKSYAVDVDGIKTYYPVKGSKRDAEQETETLQRTIKYEENIDDLTDESKVKLYEVDFELLPSMNGVKRKYVINIVSGNLYSIDQVHYEGLIYHTPRYGVRKKESDETSLMIHYECGYTGGEKSYEQKVPISQTSAVTLDKNKFKRDGMEFIGWRLKDTEEKIDSEEGNRFEKRTDGYYTVVNGLSEILGEDWEREIIEYIEEKREDREQTEDESKAEIARTQTINRIISYLIYGDTAEQDINQLILDSNISNPTPTIRDLAEWFLSDPDVIPYLTGLQNYEKENLDIGDGTSASSISGIDYRDQESNVDMAGADMWLVAEWGDGKVTLIAEIDENGATVNGKPQDEIGVSIGDPYGDLLVDADTRAGYIFSGWWSDPTDENNPSDRIYPSDIYDLSKPITLYAHWKQEESANIATITYDACLGGKIDGENTQTKIVKKVKQDTLGKLPTAIVEGVEFKKEWYIEPTGGTKVTDKTLVNGDMHLYCQWVKIELDLNGGNLVRREGNSYNTPALVEKFSNWNPVKNNAIYVADRKTIGDQKKLNYSQLPVSKGAGWNRYIEKIREDGSKATFLGWYTRSRRTRFKNKLW